ncbi:hypothetical protein SAMN05216480_1182 [Pustulibacterium marinum]|uniref:Uncharacterized protein n=1 Tax=Pustulibacterium marinum TaxID=1224947 RepID=A0A1I7IMD4_9FLAO|nr:ankyrin repeat domain-containing protein [Pustulibacterium marinum]SFU74066.1 hypothetical protein SAMN05216480_1182 [Pustulibacterium marinum]
MKTFLSLFIGLVVTLSSFGQQTIFDAAQSGDIAALKSIITKDALAINKQNNEGYTPLMLAVNNGDLNTINYLLKNGANVNAQDHSGNTALMSAAYKNHTTIAKQLLAYDASVVVMNFDQATALTLATQYENYKIAALLLAHGANVHTKDSNGKSALDYAKSQQNKDFIELVTNQGNKTNKVETKRVGSYMSNSIKTLELHKNKPTQIAGCYMQ